MFASPSRLTVNETRNETFNVAGIPAIGVPALRELAKSFRELLGPGSMRGNGRREKGRKKIKRGKDKVDNTGDSGLLS